MRSFTVFKVSPVNPRPPARAGEVLPVFLEQSVTIYGHTSAGPHRTGNALVLPDGRLEVTILDTNAGRHAIAMIRDDLVDAVHWKGSVRLRVPGDAKAAAAWKSLASWV